MKQVLLLFLFITFSISPSSNAQGPPPPCGLGYTLTGCDGDADGFTQFKLTDANDYLFCNRIETDFEPPKFYTDKEYTNEIVNYESYINISSPQTIYANAVYKRSGEIAVLNEFDMKAEMLT